MKHMRRLILTLAVTLAAVLLLPLGALAKSLTGGTNWSATYTTGGTMNETYNEQEYVDQVKNLQPGDDITFTVSAIHENASEADWYVSNDVIKSLEEQSANSAEGSGYEYVLTWTGPSQTRELYNSTKVGGADNQEGLNEATDAMDEFIYLERMKKGQSGKVTLKVTLDGESEGNEYFDTLARVKVRFAVEPDPEPTSEIKHVPGKNTVITNRELVRTGDDSNLFPFYVAMFVSGIALMALLVWSRREHRKEREEAIR